MSLENLHYLATIADSHAYADDSDILPLTNKRKRKINKLNESEQLHFIEDAHALGVRPAAKKHGIPYRTAYYLINGIQTKVFNL
jgi:hypothetical protein